VDINLKTGWRILELGVQLTLSWAVGVCRVLLLLLTLTLARPRPLAMTESKSKKQEHEEEALPPSRRRPSGSPRTPDHVSLRPRSGVACNLVAEREGVG
jgi:hypothetical protein